MKKTLVEVCCGSADDVIRSYQAGADRVELNSNLFLGGLTPSLGELIVASRQTDIEIIAMLRPREGGFCYTEMEFATIIEDARLLLANGADGLVFGFLHSDGTIDVERTKTLIALANGRPCVFHRAFDVVPDWKTALDTLIELGIRRVLTSGQESNVFFATDTVRDMIHYADGRIEILPGAGITLKNMQRVITETGCDQIHVACHQPQIDTSTNNNRQIFFGGALYPPEDRFNMIDPDAISQIIKTLQ